MKRPLHLSFAVFAAVSTLSFLPSAATAQGPPQPTEQHKLLHRDVGTWDADCKMWMSPDAPPMPFVAVEKNRLLEGGLWIVSEFTSDMGPMKFEGHGVFGYDPFEKKYVGTWIDNMSPSISPMEGTYDEETKTLTMHFKGRDPATGKKVEMKTIVRYIDEDNKLFEMHAPGKDGKMRKTMEMKYTRRK